MVSPQFPPPTIQESRHARLPCVVFDLLEPPEFEARPPERLLPGQPLCFEPARQLFEVEAELRVHLALDSRAAEKRTQRIHDSASFSTSVIAPAMRSH